MKKLLINLSLMGALGLIAPSAINNIQQLVNELKSIEKFAFTSIAVSGKTTFTSDSVKQDSKGNYWLSSPDGLWKSPDGINFTKIPASSGLPDSGTTADYYYFEDKTGGIYIANGSASGWTLYVTKDYGTTFKAVVGIPAGFTRLSIIEDSEAFIWITTNQGLFRSYSKTDNSSFSQIKSIFPTDFAPYDVFQTSAGPIYVVDGFHVYVSTDATYFHLCTATGLPATMGGQHVSSPKFFEDSIGTLYIYTNWALFRCNTLNPFTIDSVTQVLTPVKTSGITSMLVDKTTNTLWLGLSNASDQGQIVKSTDFGKTLINVGPSTLSAGSLSLDNRGNIWATCYTTTTNSFTGIYIINTYTSTATQYLSGSNVYSNFQDNQGNIWVTSKSALYKSTSEAFSKTGYKVATGGKIIKDLYDGQEFFFANQNVDFYANDSSVTNVVVNGKETLVGGQGFNKILSSEENGGKFYIAVSYSDGTIASYNFIVVNNNKNMAQFSTAGTNKMQSYVAKLKGAYINYMFIRSNSPTGSSNLQIILNSVGFDPIIDAANSSYEQVNSTTFIPIAGTKVALSADSNITKNGLYLITLVDLVGNTNQYYAQLGSQNDTPFLGPINPLLPDGAATPKPNNLGLIIGASIGGALVLILIAAGAFYYYKSSNKNKKIHASKSKLKTK